jgi:4-amino-4-deoxy-L-arabinose transferase-like glycosyltransferase
VRLLTGEATSAEAERTESDISFVDDGARVLALASAGGVAWLAHRTGVLSVGLDESFGGRLLAGLDDARPLIVAVLGYVLAIRATDRASVLRRLAHGAVWWWAALALAVIAAGTHPGPRRLAVWAVLGRHPGLPNTPPWLAIGSLVFTVGLAALLAPWWHRLRRSPRAVDRATVAAVAASVLWVVFTDGSTRDWPPYFVGALAIGANIAWRANPDRGHRLPSRRSASVIAASTITVAWWLLPAGEPTRSGFVGGIGLALVLISIGATLCAVRAPATSPNLSARVPLAARYAALLGLPLALFGEPALGLLARQHRERFTPPVFGADGTVGTAVLVGPSLPLFVWSLVLAVSLGAAAATIDNGCTALVRRRIPSWRPSGFAAILVGVSGAGLAWRVATWLTIAPERTDGGDPLFYHTAANLFARGFGWPEPLNWIAFGKLIPSALHGPGYPLYLSIASRIGGTSYVDHKFASVIAGAAIVPLVGLIGRRIGGTTVGIIAAILAAAHPNLWIIDGVLFPEGLFAAATTLGILLAYRWRDRHRLHTAVALGATVGFATLVRGEGLFLTVILILPWMLLDRTIIWRRRVLHLVAAAVGTIALVGPWAIYNVPRFETFVPLSTNGNELHVYSNCEDTYSGKFLGFWLFECQERIRRVEGEPPGDEAQRAVAWRKVGFDYARDHADELPKVVAARVARQWDVFRPFQNVEFAAIEGRDTTAAGWGLAFHWTLALPAIAGLVILRRRRVAVLPLVAQIIGVTITAAYAYGTTRFRAPAEPVICLLAAVAIAPFLTKTARRFAPTPRPVPIDGEDAFVRGGHRPGRTRRRVLHFGLPTALIAALVALPLRGLYRQPGSTMEEGFMLVFPERVLRGDVPNVDFLHLYGPGSLHVLAGVYRVFGTTLTVERTFGLLQHIAILAAVYVLVRAYGRLAAVFATSLSALLVLTPIGLSALAWNGGVALALWSVVLGLRAPHTGQPQRWYLASGALVGLALTYRPDLVLAVALAWAFLLTASGRTEFIRRLRPWSTGAVIGLVPMWYHLVVAGPRAAFRGMFIDPVFRLREGRQLPRPPSFGHLDGALQVIGERVPPWWGLPAPPASVQLFIWFFLLPAITIGVVVIALTVHRRAECRERSSVLVAASLLGLGLLPQALQRPDSAHFAWVGCVTVALLVPALIEVIALVRPNWHRVTRTGLASGIVAVTLLVTFPYYSYRVYLAHTLVSIGVESGGRDVERGGRTFVLGDERSWRASMQVVRDLDEALTPGERLIVGPVDLRQTAYSDVFFYHLFPELVPGTYFIEMDPGLANAEDAPLADEIARADWLILTRFWSGWIEPNGSIVFGPDTPNVVVEEQFCLVGSYERDLVRLYRKCPGGGAPGPYEGPYDPTVDYAVEVDVPVPPRSDGTYPPGSPAALRTEDVATPDAAGAVTP